VYYGADAEEQKTFILDNVQYIPNFWVNLFSLMAAIAKGCTITNEGRTIIIEKNSLKLKFDEEIKMKNSFVCGVILEVSPDDNYALSTVNATRKKDINELHKALGHASEMIIRDMAKFYKWPLTNQFAACKSCALAKSCQKNTNKEKKARSKSPGEQLFINISHPQAKSFSGLQYWLLAIDDATDFSFSLFLKTKDQMASAMISLIKDLRDTHKIVIKKIRCNNSGENVAFQAEAKKEGLGLNFEYTAHQTPQQNGRVERKFATLIGRVRSMLNLAGLTGERENLRHGLWAECAEMATKMENILAKPDKEPPFQQLYKKDPLFLTSLHVFREIGVVNNAQQLRSKLANRGEHMFVGYANNHAGDTFKMLNLKTKWIWKSRDVKWIAVSLSHLAKM